MATPLHDVLAAAAPDAARRLGAPDAAEAALAALCADAAAAWPDVAIAPAALIAAIGARLAGDAPPALGPDLATELHLALGCAGGDAAAIRHFERRYLDVVPAALAPMKLPAATVEDVRAVVRDRLLVADGDAPPRVVVYAGQGRLRGLVQVSAVRAAISLLRKTARELPIAGDDVGGAAALDHDAELALIKAQYRAAFTAAFAAAVRGLDRRDRTLLRLHFLGGMTLEQLAAMYGVHRATAVRWLAAARKQILADTRRRLRDDHGVPAAELDDLVALVQSRLEVSVRRLLSSLETSAGP